MALSQPPPFDSVHAPARPGQSIAEGNQGYRSPQNMTGPYGQYGLQARQQGYNTGQNEERWIERVLEEVKDMLVLLNSEGHIAYASPSSKQITGRSPKQLEGGSLMQHIHEGDRAVFKRDMKEAIAGNRPFRTHVRLQKANSTYCLVEVYGHPHIANQDPEQDQSPSAHDHQCLGFFLMCRPHPSKNSLLLDSFLEHKIENARLVQQIAKLKEEEEEEGGLSRGMLGRLEDEGSLESMHAQGGSSDQDSSETAAPISDESDNSQDADYYTGRPSLTESSLSHIDGIEVMTGLHYGDGERSQGLSTGVRRGRLVHCDIDITTSADQARSAQEGDRRKRLKGQHHCGDCGTGDSPEWRKGPNGPKTLCNACGCEYTGDIFSKPC